jgi:hypothetical protein
MTVAGTNNSFVSDGASPTITATQMRHWGICMPTKFISPISSSHRLAKILLALITIIVIALSAFGAQKWLRSMRAMSGTAPAHSNRQQNREPVQVARFALYDEGIQPYELNVSKGLIAIEIEDASGGTTGLVIARDVGQGRPLENVRNLKRTRSSRRDRFEIKLAPGNYVIYDERRAASRASLIVEQ